MSRALFIVSLLIFALCVPVAMGQETADEKEKASNEAGSHEGEKKAAKKSTGASRDFLKLAEPATKKKKKGDSARPYGSYWTALYGGRTEAEAGIDEETGEPEEPAFSPYYAKPSKPRKTTRPRVSGDLKLTPLTPPPLSEFVEVDFARFASGAFASEYADKFVKLKCEFASLAPQGMRLKEFPAPEYVNFMVKGVGTTMYGLTVAMPSAKARKLFGLESHKEIFLYGRAVRLGMSRLTVLVEKVDITQPGTPVK